MSFSIIHTLPPTVLPFSLNSHVHYLLLFFLYSHPSFEKIYLFYVYGCFAGIYGLLPTPPGLFLLSWLHGFSKPHTGI